MRETYRPENPADPNDLPARRAAFVDALNEMSDQDTQAKLDAMIEALARFLVRTQGRSYDVALNYSTLFFAECVMKGVLAKVQS